MATDQLDQLLRDRFDLDRAALIAALETLSAHRPWATRLTAGEAHLLDAAGLAEDADAYAEMAADLAAHMGRLYSTAYSASEVAVGLGVGASRVRQRRLDRTLWAIDDGGTWTFPAVQFEQIDARGAGKQRIKQVRGLDRALPQLLSLNLHPTAVSSFLLQPQPDLLIGRQATAVRDWLLHGEPVEPVLRLIDIEEWAAT